MDREIVNHADHSREAPLHVAAKQDDVACLELLLMHGGDYTLGKDYYYRYFILIR
jgi:ankyrin repeat protein